MQPLILVTGGLGDIGLAIARKFSANDWLVAANDIHTQTEGDARVREIGPGVRYFEADNRNRAAVDAMVTAVSEIAPLRVVAGNAGIVEPAPFLDTTSAQWARHMDVNLTGAFHVAQSAARWMVEHGHGGTILFTGSWVQDVPSRGIGAYCVSKSGLKMLAKQMALELASHNILVNVVAPGNVDAGVSAQMFRTGKANPRAVEKMTPLGRLQTADEVADAFWLLAQPEAAYITGATLLCDGGASLFQR